MIPINQLTNKSTGIPEGMHLLRTQGAGPGGILWALFVLSVPLTLLAPRGGRAGEGQSLSGPERVWRGIVVFHLCLLIDFMVYGGHVAPDLSNVLLSITGLTMNLIVQLNYWSIVEN